MVYPKVDEHASVSVLHIRWFGVVWFAEMKAEFHFGVVVVVGGA